MLGFLRSFISRRLLLHRSPGLRIGPRSTVYRCTFERDTSIAEDSMILRCTIGMFSYLGPRCIASDATIGRFCSIAADVAIGSGSHPLGRNASTHPAFYLYRPPAWDFVAVDDFTEFAPTRIGHDVWIGTKAVLRDGVSIGHGAVVGAGSIVTRDLEPYGIYAGSPARLIRYRFDPQTIAALMSLAWWDRDIDWIKRHARVFSDTDTLLRVLREEAIA